MTVLADRQPVASGATTQPEPPPELPNVDDAQQFYLSGIHAWTTAVGPWFCYTITPGPVYYVEPRPGGLAWVLGRVAEELSRLGQFRPGWDGRRARPITREAIHATARVLARLLDGQSAVPQFFPLPGGGIQVEWLADDQIEIEIDGAGEAHVLATSASGDVLAEGILDPQGQSDLAATVARLVNKLSAEVAAGGSGRD
jgi:hypothetical protein